MIFRTFQMTGYWICSQSSEWTKALRGNSSFLEASSGYNTQGILRILWYPNVHCRARKSTRMGMFGRGCSGRVVRFLVMWNVVMWSVWRAWPAWGGGANLSCITLLNIHRKENYFYGHSSSTFYGTPKDSSYHVMKQSRLLPQILKIEAFYS
jgi:hypothetical protein